MIFDVPWDWSARLRDELTSVGGRASLFGLGFSQCRKQIGNKVSRVFESD
jgi:hypothetical protein